MQASDRQSGMEKIAKSNYEYQLWVGGINDFDDIDDDDDNNIH